MTYLLEIPAPAKLINANQRLHWRSKAELTLAWRKTAWGHATVANRLGRLPALDRAHITATFHFADRRKRDVGNLAPTVKAIVDGLVDAGVFVDDDDAHVVGPDLRRGDLSPAPWPVVVVAIEPLPSEDAA